MQRKTLSMLVAAAFAGASLAAVAGPVTDEMILNDAKSTGDVLSFGMGTQGQRYSTLNKINTTNIKKLFRHGPSSSAVKSSAAKSRSRWFMTAKSSSPPRTAACTPLTP